MAKRDKFVAFIDDWGPGPLAKKLGIDRQAVYRWQKRRGLPTPPHMYTIVVELSKGDVTYIDIIHPFIQLQNNISK